MTGSFRVGDWQVEPQLNLLQREDHYVHLQPKVMDVLSTLAEHAGEVLTKDDLIRAVWPDTFVSDDALAHAVWKLREAFEDDTADPKYIRTIPRRGYQLVAEVQLSERASSETGYDRPVRKFAGSWPMWLTVVITAVLATAASWYFLGRAESTGPAESLTDVPLTSYPGYEAVASFSPDGQSVAFEWCRRWASDCDIYVKQIGVEPPVQFTRTPEDEVSPVWSPDGLSIAFLREIAADRFGLIVKPCRGGNERLLAELDLSYGRIFNFPATPRLAWTPDSRYIAAPARESGDEPNEFLWLFSVESGERRRLTQPQPEAQGSGEDDNPAFSPDGRTLAFSRRGRERWKIYLLRLGQDYEPRGFPELFATGIATSRCPAWTADGTELLFVVGGGLWRMPVASRETASLFRKYAISPAVSPVGNRLAYSMLQEDTNIWQIDLSEPNRVSDTLSPLISSTWPDYYPAWSPDGRKIAFTSARSGQPAIWVCDSDGSAATQVSPDQGSWARWSPDGRNIVFETTGAERILKIIRPDGGAPRSLSTHWDEQHTLFPTWSRDGRWIYFRSMRSGRSEVWKIPSDGGDAIQVTQNTGDLPQESPDGQMLYYTKGDEYPTRCTVWRKPVPEGPESRVLDSVECFGLWEVTRQGIYYVAVPDSEDRYEIRFHDFETDGTRVITRIDRSQWARITVSPDDSVMLVPLLDRYGIDLMLVENFR